MKTMTQWLLVAVILAAGGFLAQRILTIKPNAPASNEHGHGEGERESHALGDAGAATMETEHNADHPRGDAGQPRKAEDEQSDAGSPAETAKGPHGGRYFEDGAFALELTIYEEGVPPQFRAYLYENGQPTPPASERLTVTLTRLGAAPQVFNFRAEGDYLVGDPVVEEPHSFEVAIAVERGGRTHHWSYAQTEARVELSDDALASAGIVLETAGPASIRSTLHLPGEIQFNMDRFVHVVPRVDGVVIDAPVVSGQQVRQGDVLLVIESQQLAELRSELAAARKRRDMASLAHDREKKLWQERISPEQDYLAAKQALAEANIASESARQRLEVLGVTGSETGRSLTRYEIRAPIGGLVVEKNVALGEAISQEMTLFKIADVSTVWAEIMANVQSLNSLRTGQAATVKANGLDLQATGTVSYIGALLGEQTRTAKARITLDNPDGRWRPGMFVTVDVTAEEVQVPVAVSVDALQTVRDWTVVFGRYGTFLEARPVELGRSDGSVVEVLKGFNAGERYAAKNSFVIKAELGKAGASHDH
ncbi:MAG: efflux RND transporter periplasmic adaptor subunit [Gammaproteobacteria bacterium]